MALLVLDNIQEKAITLAVALKAKSLLEQVGAKGTPTWMDDRDVFCSKVTVPMMNLVPGVAVGNKNKAHVFFRCIHANYFDNPQVCGTGTYYFQKTIYDKLLAECIQTSVINADGLNDIAAFFQPTFLDEIDFDACDAYRIRVYF